MSPFRPRLRTTSGQGCSTPSRSTTPPCRRRPSPACRTTRSDMYAKFWTETVLQNLKYLPNIISFHDTWSLSRKFPVNHETEMHSSSRPIGEVARSRAEKWRVFGARFEPGLISAPLLLSGNRQYGGLAVEGVEDEHENQPEAER